MTTKKKAYGDIWKEIEKSPERLKIKLNQSHQFHHHCTLVNPSLGSGNLLTTMFYLTTQEEGSSLKLNTPQKSATIVTALQHFLSDQRTKPWS